MLDGGKLLGAETSRIPRFNLSNTGILLRANAADTRRQLIDRLDTGGDVNLGDGLSGQKREI